jgi:pseudouridine synthase
MSVRLQKYIAMCGAASRRGAETLIVAGRVKVNGKFVTELGTKVEAGDTVELDGKVLSVEQDKLYIMLNKPVGCVTTASDQFGRKTVLDYVTGLSERVYPVGRLDYDTSGLLLLTNDGELTYRLTHPKHNVNKTYIAEVDKPLDNADVERLKNGVMLDGRMTAPAKVKLMGNSKGLTRVRITIHEGRNRQVRRMFESVGARVKTLQRVSIGELSLGELRCGEYRALSKDEIKYITGL